MFSRHTRLCMLLKGHSNHHADHQPRGDKWLDWEGESWSTCEERPAGAWVGKGAAERGEDMEEGNRGKER